MRTAKEIILEYCGLQPYGFPHSLVEIAINEARKEAIQELASRADIADDNWNPVVTKQQILDFIKELR